MYIFENVGDMGSLAEIAGKILNAHHKLLRLGIPCVVHDDPHMQVMSAVPISAEDVVVVISHTGSTRDVIETKLLSLQHSNRGATWSRTSFQ
jgi:DNA-binding MurR/RpiR family transcriptional regulator